MKRVLLFTALAAILSTTPTFAGILTVTAPDRLATMAQGLPDNNYNNVFVVGFGSHSSADNRPVLSFDVSDLTLPAYGYDVGTSQVDSLTLTLKTATGSSWGGSGSVSFDLKLYVTDASNNDWVANQATWNARKTSNAWLGSAYKPTTTFASLGTPLASQTVTSTSSGQTVTFTVTNSLVLTPLIDSWLTGSNAGLFMAVQYTANNRYLFFETTGGDAPELQVTFTNVPEPGTFAMLLFGGVMLWAVRRGRK